MLNDILKKSKKKNMRQILKEKSGERQAPSFSNWFKWSIDTFFSTLYQLKAKIFLSLAYCYVKWCFLVIDHVFRSFHLVSTATSSAQ